VDTRSWRVLVSSLTNLRPLLGLFISHSKRLFRAFASFLTGLITWAAKDKSNDASSWQTEAIYGPLARWAMYWSLGVNVRVTPLDPVLVADLVPTVLRFSHCRSCVRVIPSGTSRMRPPLNLSGVSAVSCSRSLAKNFAL
jgi:hypothetical protein